MTDDTLDDVDVTILDELRALLEIIDPMPEHLADNVKFALTVAALNAEIAELTAHEAVALRSADLALAQSITFTRGRSGSTAGSLRAAPTSKSTSTRTR